MIEDFYQVLLLMLMMNFEKQEFLNLAGEWRLD